MQTILYWLPGLPDIRWPSYLVVGKISHAFFDEGDVKYSLAVVIQLFNLSLISLFSFSQNKMQLAMPLSI
ncbi:MAG: hypothetical protein DRG82_13795 [Deltaproteobacteria bacterium]|nr:MAG: hypothetical protein DRG82_13795 [Deltaproteobacteria bacterium]